MTFVKITDRNSYNIFFSPSFVLRCFLKKCRILGYSNVIRKFKKLDEARIAAVPLLAISENKKIPIWMQVIKDEEGSPDIVGLAREKDEKGRLMRVLKPIEIFKIDYHSNNDFIEELKKKLHNKMYVPQTGVFCHLDRNQLLESIANLNLKVKKISPNVSDIWIIAATEEKYPLLTAFRVWPDINHYDVDLESLLNTPRYPEVIMVTSEPDEELSYEKLGKIKAETIADLLENGVSLQV